MGCKRCVQTKQNIRNKQHHKSGYSEEIRFYLIYKYVMLVQIGNVFQV